METNNQSTLNDHLFDQLDRLAKPDLTPEQIEDEVRKTDAIVKVADKIISNATLTLDACKLVATHGDHYIKQLPMLKGPYEGQDYAGSKDK